jgi:hypothetical protein
MRMENHRTGLRGSSIACKVGPRFISSVRLQLKGIALGTQAAADLPLVSSRLDRRERIIAAAASGALLCCSLTSCTKTQVTLSVAAIAAVVVGTTVGVTLAVQHSHHTLEGCISSGANGPELRLNNSKTYTLKGELADIKVGDRLKIHGTRVKKVKDSTAGDQVFVVEKVKKNYGPCPVSAATATAH